MPRKIVAAVDPYRSDDQFVGINDSIINAAEKLAAECNAQLHLLYAYDLSYVFASADVSVFSSSLGQAVYEADADAFNTLAERYGVPQECRHLVMGNPAKVIESYAQTQDVDVIVMGTVHRSRPTALLGSTTEQVAYHMACSLLAINPRYSTY